MGELASLSASGVWATASLIFARLGKTVSALALNWLKCVIALVFMVASMALLQGQVWPGELGMEETLILGLSGVVGLSVGDTAFFHALNRLGPRRTLLLSALSPPTTAVMAVPVLGEPLTWTMALGMGLTMGGVVWVILERHPDADQGEERRVDGSWTSKMKWGVVLGVVYATCQALGNVLTKLGGGEITALEISVVRLAFGILGLTLVLGATRRLMETWVPMRHKKTAVLVVAATFLGTFMGIWLMNAGLRYTYTGIASTLASLSPVFILPLAYFVEGEELSLRSILGAVVAVGGVAVLFLM